MSSARRSGNTARGPERSDAIELATRSDWILAIRPLSGGNLVVAGGYLLIATPTELIALGPHAAPVHPTEHEVTQEK